MNIALEQTEEYVNGRVINRYGDAFIRGNNGAHILLPSTCTLHLTLFRFSPLYLGRGNCVKARRRSSTLGIPTAMATLPFSRV